MGRPKQLLEVNGRPMLSGVLDALSAADVEGICVVTNATIAAKMDFAAWPRVFVVENNDEQTEMIDSIRLGIRAWRDRVAPRPTDGLLVCPGDHPGITTADFNACIAAFQASPDQIVIASRAGRRGHPIVLAAELAGFVESAACNNGLRALPHSMPERVALVECRSPGVDQDVDTPSDYKSLN